MADPPELEAAGGHSRVRSRTPIFGVLHMTTACSIAARSSRTFPGQLYSRMQAIASGARSRTGLAFSLADSLRNACTSSGRSSLRARSGGIVKGTTFRRKVEIFPEPSFSYQCGEIFVGRRDQADIRLQRLVAADPFEGPLTEHTKDFDLRVLVDFTDLIEKSVPPAACSKRPIRRSNAPVKAPFSWPNNSLSRSCGEKALQCTAMNFFAARVLRA